MLDYWKIKSAEPDPFLEPLQSWEPENTEREQLSAPHDWNGAGAKMPIRSEWSLVYWSELWLRESKSVFGVGVSSLNSSFRFPYFATIFICRLLTHEVPWVPPAERGRDFMLCHKSHSKFEVPTVTPSVTICIFLNPVASPASGYHGTRCKNGRFPHTGDKRMFSCSSENLCDP